MNYKLLLSLTWELGTELVKNSSSLFSSCLHAFCLHALDAGD